MSNQVQFYLQETEFDSIHCSCRITSTYYIDANDTSSKERSIEQRVYGLVLRVLTIIAFNSTLVIGLNSPSIVAGSHFIFMTSRIIATSNTIKAIIKSVPSFLSLLSSPE